MLSPTSSICRAEEKLFNSTFASPKFDTTSIVCHHLALCTSYNSIGSRAGLPAILVQRCPPPLGSSRRIPKPCVPASPQTDAILGVRLQLIKRISRSLSMYVYANQDAHNTHVGVDVACDDGQNSPRWAVSFHPCTHSTLLEYGILAATTR